MHVDAKRYLCAVDPAYLERLSAVSARTLRMQGGAMDSEEIFEFEAHPLANEFIRLRLWDDQAKDPSMVTLPLTEWQPIIAGYFPS
jgi:gamma-butyrobetaine dioxygenase